MTKGPLTKVFTASLVAQMVKNLPAVQETQFRSQGWEDSLQKRMATHSRILAWRIPCTEEQAVGLQSVRHAECLSLPVSSKSRLGSFP